MILACKNGKPYLEEKKKSVQSKQLVIKLVVVGLAKTGKSCFVNQNYAENQYMSTIGVDFRIYKHSLPNGKNCTFQVWDTAGTWNQQKIKSFYRFKGVLLFMYDTSCRQSFDFLKKLMQEIIDENLIEPTTKGILIANKSDLESFVIDEKQIKQLTDKIGTFKKISVKNKPNSLELMFEQIYDLFSNSQVLSIFERSDKFTAPTQNLQQSQPQIQKLQFVMNVILIGPVKVGKTSILRQYADHKFQNYYLPTIGVDFKIKFVETNGKAIKLQLWDTAGQQRFRVITKSFYNAVRIAYFIYDCQNYESFKAIQNFYKEFMDLNQGTPYCCLVSNKNDIDKQKQVSSEEGMQLAQNLKINFTEVSCKDHQSLTKMFQGGVDWIIKNEELV